MVAATFANAMRASWVITPARLLRVTAIRPRLLRIVQAEISGDGRSSLLPAAATPPEATGFRDLAPRLVARSRRPRRDVGGTRKVVSRSEVNGLREEGRSGALVYPTAIDGGRRDAAAASDGKTLGGVVGFDEHAETGRARPTASGAPIAGLSLPGRWNAWLVAPRWARWGWL